MKRKTINQGRICSSVTSVYLKARWAFPHGSLVKNPPGNAGDAVWSLSWEDPLEKEKVIHSSILVWATPRTEEHGRRNMLNNSVAAWLYMWLEIWRSRTCFRRRQWHPAPVLLPGKSHGWRSLVGCRLWGHTELDTLKRLSSSSRVWLLIKEESISSVDFEVDWNPDFLDSKTRKFPTSSRVAEAADSSSIPQPP